MAVLAAAGGFSDLERSLGIATAVDAVCSRAYWSFSDLERSLGIATAMRRPAAGPSYDVSVTSNGR